MKRFISILKRYNVCFIPCPEHSTQQNTRLLRNIKALGYDCIKIAGRYKECANAKEFYVVICSNHYKESFSLLADKMTEICKKNEISSAFCFHAGNPKGNIYYSDGSINPGAVSYFQADNSLSVITDEKELAIETASDIIDHTIRTAGMYKEYTK